MIKFRKEGSVSAKKRGVTSSPASGRINSFRHDNEGLVKPNNDPRVARFPFPPAPPLSSNTPPKGASTGFKTEITGNAAAPRATNICDNARVLRICFREPLIVVPSRPLALRNSQRLSGENANLANIEQYSP